MNKIKNVNSFTTKLDAGIRKRKREITTLENKYDKK